LRFLPDFYFDWLPKFNPKVSLWSFFDGFVPKDFNFSQLPAQAFCIISRRLPEGIGIKAFHSVPWLRPSDWRRTASSWVSNSQPAGLQFHLRELVEGEVAALPLRVSFPTSRNLSRFAPSRFQLSFILPEGWISVNIYS
jgi:hypothetical protein